MYWNYDYDTKSEVLVGRPQKFTVTVARVGGRGPVAVA